MSIGTGFYTSDLIKKINEIGKDKIRFFVLMRRVHIIPFIGWGMTTSSDLEHYIECYIDEERYEVDKEYKITLRACDTAFGSKTYYTCDLASHIKAGIVKIKEEGDFVEEVTLEESVGGGACIRTTFEIISNRLYNAV